MMPSPAALKDIGVEQVYNGKVGTLVWILLVGGVAAKDTEESIWFVKRLNGLVEWQDVTRLAEVKAITDELLVDGKCNG